MLPIQFSGSSTFPTRSRDLILKDVHVSPSLIKNLISIRKLTVDNYCTVKFTPFDFV